MTELEILYDKIYSENIALNPKHFIDLYEANQNLIEGADASISNPDYDGIMRISADYALSLSHYGSSRKAIPYLDKAIQLFKNCSSEDLTKVPMFEMLIWTRGVEYFNQKNYSLAVKDFQYLVDSFPDNDRYRNWLYSSKTIKLKKYTDYLWFGVLISLVWHTMVNEENTNLKDNLLIAATVLFVIAIAIELFNFILKSRIKKQ